MYATPTSLSLIQAASLKLESDFVVPGADVSLLWVYDTPIYNAGGTGVGGATWFNFDRTALDAAFPANPDASANNWTIATAVPEPSLTAFLTLAGLGCCVTRRRIKF